LLESTAGAQRASTSPIRTVMVAVLAALLSISALGASASPADAAVTRKVVIVVGPVGSQTANYIYNAKQLATQAKGYGANVVQIYSPYATWTKVKAAAAGAHMLIYLGHGNGHPSPYGSFSQYTKDGMGLNKTSGAGNSNVKYYGEYYMKQLGMAPNSVVVLNRLCYASGNSEWGAANPTKSTAIQRVDNYGAGFLRSGAKAVFASGITSVSYVLKALFRGSSSLNMTQVFWTDPNATKTYKFTFTSTRTSGTHAVMDPYRLGRYYRSVIGVLPMTVAQWRS